MISGPFRVRPDFLVIGAQKCGTSALHYYLSQHPSLVPARRKELDFFSCDVNYGAGVDSYHRNFPIRNLRRRLAYETSPSYLHNPKAAERIREYDDDMKLIAILRDPVERAFSAWRMYASYFSVDPEWYVKWMVKCSGSNWDSRAIVRRTSESIMEFDVYISQELSAYQAGQQIEAPVLSHGLYARQIERFSSHRLLLLASSQLKSEPDVSLSKVEMFLQVPSFNWRLADLRRVLVGHRGDLEIPANARDRMTEYYRLDSKLLRDRYGVFFS